MDGCNKRKYLIRWLFTHSTNIYCTGSLLRETKQTQEVQSLMQEMDVGTTSLASRRICMTPGTERAGGTGKSQPTFIGKVGSALQGGCH